MEVLPVLQALSTPVLIAIGYLAKSGLTALHKIDRRLVRVETKLGVVSDEDI